MNTKKASCIPTIAMIETNMWIKKIIMTEIRLASDHTSEIRFFQNPLTNGFIPVFAS